ncbi:MAG: hydroxyacid dehydrogenase [Deltaproteobacteria bacterium]|jgi:phosphoglycerate dehydrogenase-like enzyme|nr:hydroxyacid dehydrogenase [Deltaproteobacteria bacterium]
MKYWKNTATLDHLLPELLQTVGANEAEVAVIGSKAIDLEVMSNLKGIFKCGVGTDNVPFADAKERGIEICLPSEKTQRYIFEETANFAVYLIFRMLYADIGSLERWEKRSRVFLGNQKVLVLGQGNIGKMVSNKLTPFVKVLSFDVAVNEMSELQSLMEQADVISLHIPLDEQTRNFIDVEKMSWMKDGASIVNTARGPVVDEDALYMEVSTGRLRAAFDVYWKEPYQGKLREHHTDKFLMTPHVSSNCEDFLIGLADDLKEFVNKLS